MKSQKGVTMISLVLYIASFLVITATIAGITTFFYNNVEVLDTSIGSNSQYNKFNLYFLNECKKSGNQLLAWKESSTLCNYDRLKEATKIKENKFITFKDKEGNKNSFIYEPNSHSLYYNTIKLCDNVEEFKINLDDSTGKTVLKIFINIGGTVFSTEYVVQS